jgi:NAD(P)-dependent dehydrogenase (short-subunit alcohol dehydrogenase family)
VLYFALVVNFVTLRKTVLEDVLDPLFSGSQRFAGRVCIVTGSGQGIGRAAAKRLGAEGGKIVVAERVRESAMETLAQLHAHGAQAIEAISDVSTFAGARDLMQRALAAFGRIDVLVNVVGGAIWWKPFHLFSEEEIMLELERNLSTAMWCCSAALPIMVEQGRGAIVNCSSGVTRGKIYRTPYAIGKGGVEAMTRTLAKEYGQYGIRVNAISPGSTKVNDRTTSRLSLRPGVLAESSPEMEARIQEATADPVAEYALQRSSTTAEHAGAIAFLASDDAGYVTGQILNCHGDP